MVEFCPPADTFTPAAPAPGTACTNRTLESAKAGPADSRSSIEHAETASKGPPMNPARRHSEAILEMPTDSFTAALDELDPILRALVELPSARGSMTPRSRACSAARRRTSRTSAKPCSASSPPRPRPTQRTPTCPSWRTPSARRSRSSGPMRAKTGAKRTSSAPTFFPRRSTSSARPRTARPPARACTSCPSRSLSSRNGSPSRTTSRTSSSASPSHD